MKTSKELCVVCATCTSFLKSLGRFDYLGLLRIVKAMTIKQKRLKLLKREKKYNAGPFLLTDFQIYVLWLILSKPDILLKVT